MPKGECSGCSFAKTYWIIQVLEDSFNRNIEYENKFWIRENAQKLQIAICVEDCVITGLDSRISKAISKNWDYMLVQEGKVIDLNSVECEFNYNKEALFLEKYSQTGKYYIYLYSPQKH